MLVTEAILIVFLFNWKVIIFCENRRRLALSGLCLAFLSQVKRLERALGSIIKEQEIRKRNLLHIRCSAFGKIFRYSVGSGNDSYAVLLEALCWGLCM